MGNTDDKKAEFERALSHALPEPVELRLFIAGMGVRSTRAISDLKRLCDEFAGRCSLEIVDVYEQPAEAARAQIVAVPTVVRDHPLPRRKLIGALDNVGAVARGLGLAPPRPEGAA